LRRLTYRSSYISETLFWFLTPDSDGSQDLVAITGSKNHQSNPD
jgi:hypothetical protein